jgi:hypothetical protein
MLTPAVHCVSLAAALLACAHAGQAAEVHDQN